MIRPIVTDAEYLKRHSEEIRDPDMIAKVAADLIDTAAHHEATPIGCLGLAGIQVAHPHRIIVIKHGGAWMPMVNPEITMAWGGRNHKTEGCLSRPGRHVRKLRYKKIKVQYWNLDEDLFEQRFSGMAARVIQHEIDHLDGRYI